MITYRQAIPWYNEARGRNLKASESDGLECNSVYCTLEATSKEFQRHDQMVNQLKMYFYSNVHQDIFFSYRRPFVTMQLRSRWF